LYFRKTAWKMDQETWCRLHEEAWRSFGGCVQYEVIDNLKQGVLQPDLYDPELNPLFAALLAHYSVVADPCRVADPDRKGAVENAIQHPGHGPEGAPVRDDRGPEHLAGPLGGALGRAPDPRPPEAPGPGDVR
jgi:hypothetical protein